MKRCFFTLLMQFTMCAYAQSGPRVIAKYEGGHIGIKTLTLYSDSTFQYLSVTDIMFFSSSSKGKFARIDSSITLYTKRSFSFMRLPKNRYSVSTWRLKDDKILFYTIAQEKSADANFYKAYNTLKLLPVKD